MLGSNGIMHNTKKQGVAVLLYQSNILSNFPPLRCKHILMYINAFHYFGHCIEYLIKHFGEIFTDILLLVSQELLLRGNLPPDNLLFERFVQLNIKIPV